MSIKVVIADDHHLVREGLVGMLSEVEGIEVIGEAENGIEAISQAKKLAPDVIIMDINMPEMNGIEATKKITTAYPQIKVLVLTMHSDEEYIRQMLNAGAKGYLLKNTKKEGFERAIKAVHNKENYFSTAVSGILISKFTDSDNDEKDKYSSLTATLSDRELEIVIRLADGFINKEIGDQLFISVRTVETHRRNIMHKLQIHTIADLVRIAVKAGLSTT